MRYLLVLAVLVSGCAPKVCDPAKGTYEWTVTEVTGDCGPIDPWVGPSEFWVPGGAWTDAPCIIQQDGTSTECSVQRTSSCEYTDGSRSVWRYDVGFSGDGRTITGTLETSVYATGTTLTCQSNYQLEAVWIGP